MATRPCLSGPVAAQCIMGKHVPKEACSQRCSPGSPPSHPLILGEKNNNKKKKLQGQGGDGRKWGRGKLKRVSPGQGRQESEDSLLGFTFCSQIQMRREGSKKTQQSF